MELNSIILQGSPVKSHEMTTIPTISYEMAQNDTNREHHLAKAAEPEFSINLVDQQTAEFVCNWEACNDDFDNHRDFIIHLKSHVKKQVSGFLTKDWTRLIPANGETAGMNWLILM